MTLTIQGELPTLNEYVNAERTNKFMAAKMKKEWTEKVAWLAKAAKLKKVKEPIPELIIDWYTKNERKDADNIVFAKKFLLDGLVMAGVLPTDGRKFVTRFNEAVWVDRKNPRVEVEL